MTEDESARTEWISVFTSDSMQRAYVYAGGLQAQGMPAVVVPRPESAYPLAALSVFEVRVPLAHAPAAVLWLEREG